MLAIVSSCQHWHVYLEGTPDIVHVLSDHKALEYIMTTKALTAQQACWAEILSQFNFQIMCKPGVTNCADALTRWEQDLDNQIAKKIALWTQMFLGPECLDPQIQAELDKDLLNAELCSINKSGLDFIDELLQANCTATSLQEYCEEAKDGKGKWTLENGLLKHQEWLVVAKGQNLQTCLITEAHCQVSTAHLGKNKTHKIIGDHYYWPGMTIDIDQYVQNCNDCR